MTKISMAALLLASMATFASAQTVGEGAGGFGDGKCSVGEGEGSHFEGFRGTYSGIVSRAGAFISYRDSQESYGLKTGNVGNTTGLDLDSDGNVSSTGNCSGEAGESGTSGCN